MRERVVIRCPMEWQGHVDSAWVESRMQDFFVHRPLLPDDPGCDGGRVSLSLPRKPLRVFCALLDQPVSSSLRRLIAGYSNELPDPRPHALPVNTSLAPERRAMDVEPQVRRALPAPMGQKIARASDGALLDARTAQRLWEPDRRGAETRTDQRGNTFAEHDSRKPKPFSWIELAFAVLTVALILIFTFYRRGTPEIGADPFKAWVPTR